MNKITSITRKRILETLIGSRWSWHGRLNEVEFLNRILDLKKLPSSDSRFKDMYVDIYQHRINNDDYEQGWFISDSRLNLLNVEDSIFMKFLTEVLNPEVVENAQARDNFSDLFNALLINDGYEIIPAEYISGEPAYRISAVNEAEKLRNVLLKLEAGCIAVSTDGTFSDSEYNALRNLLRPRKDLYQLLPDFIRSYNQTKAIRSKMQSIDGHYAGRREHIQQAFLMSFQFIDNLSGISDPFSDTLEHIEDGEIIGQGGFGVVYKVKHKHLDRSFAIKVLRKSPFSIGQHEVKRFFKEANILFGLNHPNIIRIYDVGIYNTEPFIRMEYFQGKNLNQILCDFGRFPSEKAFVMISAIASALAYAHDTLKVVHRDLKPSNIMAAPPEQFKVIDFGLGVYVEDELASRITRTGEVVAGGIYTAPELLANPKLRDQRCDIYSLGAIWYECLLGRAPHGIGFVNALTSEISIPKSHQNIIVRMLQSDPNQRYSSWSELLKDIAGCAH